MGFLPCRVRGVGFLISLISILVGLIAGWVFFNVESLIIQNLLWIIFGVSCMLLLFEGVLIMVSGIYGATAVSRGLHRSGNCVVLATLFCFMTSIVTLSIDLYAFPDQGPFLFGVLSLLFSLMLFTFVRLLLCIMFRMGENTCE